MRYFILLAVTVLLASCATGGKQKSTDGSDSGTKSAVWREDGTSGDKPKGEEPAKSEGEATPPEPQAEAAPKAEPESPQAQPDPTVERKPEPEPEPAKAEQPEPEKTSVQPQPAVDPAVRGQLADDFVRAVNGQVPALEKSRSWIQYDKDYKAFKDAQTKALAERRKGEPDKQALEQAWADCIKAWYDARFSMERFLHLHKGPTDFEAVNIRARDEVSALPIAQLRSPECRRNNAAHVLAGRTSPDLKIFHTTVLKYDLTANAVYESEDWLKVFEAARDKFQKAAAGSFDEADLKAFKD